jgi:hypothetical protein
MNTVLVPQSFPTLNPGTLKSYALAPPSYRERHVIYFSPGAITSLSHVRPAVYRGTRVKRTATATAHRERHTTRKKNRTNPSSLRPPFTHPYALPMLPPKEHSLRASGKLHRLRLKGGGCFPSFSPADSRQHESNTGIIRTPASDMRAYCSQAPLQAPASGQQWRAVFVAAVAAAACHQWLRQRWASSASFPRPAISYTRHFRSPTPDEDCGFFLFTRGKGEARR